MRVLSFGGGVQTTALAVLWVRGDVQADYAVMADTGGETPETYAHVEVVRRYLEEYGRTLETVAFSGDTLEDYIWARSTPIPVILDKGIGHRQCTNKWKVEPVKRYAREHGVTALTMLLGISWDEIHRIKPDPERWVTREYPLVDMRLTRQDCKRITAEAGLPPAPKSACFFCPLQSMNRWRRLAVEHPDLFERAAQLEDVINSRRDSPAYISNAKKPLRTVQTASALLPGFEAIECEGVCFV